MSQQHRSVQSEERVFLRFVNKTKRQVNIIWLNYNGEPVNYNLIMPDTYRDIDTFKTHPWIFEDSLTRDRLVVNKEFVFYPPSWIELFRKQFPNLSAPNEVPNHRLVVMITLPVYSLRQRCLQVLRDRMTDDTSDMLATLPKSVLDDLVEMVRLKRSIGEV